MNVAEFNVVHDTPNVVSSAVTAETCSQLSTILSRNMGLSDSRYSHYLRKSYTGRENNSHGVQFIQGDRREGLEGASRTHSTQEFSQCFCHRNITHSFLLPLSFVTDDKLNIYNNYRSNLGTSLKYCKDRTILNSQCTLTIC